MTYNLKERIDEIETALVRVQSRLEELEQVAEEARGDPSESFQSKIDDMRHQKELMEKHLGELEVEKIQSWKDSTFGNDLVKLANSIIARADAFLRKTDI